MSDILSVIGIIVSVIGVILSLLLFNGSVNNSRKIILNKAIRFITFDHELLGIFFDATKERSVDITVERIYKFNKNMFLLEEMLKDIRIENKFGIPTIPEEEHRISDDEYKHTFALSKMYKEIYSYFKERKLPNFELMLNEYDDRCLFLQHYNKKIRYIRKFLIGPIVGLKYIYRRKKKVVKYGKVEVKLVKNIKSIEDFYKYYDKCYCYYDFLGRTPKFEKERTINDVIFVTDEDNRIPISIYR